MTATLSNSEESLGSKECEKLYFTILGFFSMASWVCDLNPFLFSWKRSGFCIKKECKNHVSEGWKAATLVLLVQRLEGR